jgi:3-oxoacyl-[acyl-carrier-protein] synthase-3
MLYLHGMGHFYPENVISNQLLEDLDIGTTEEWILERVGIHTRRTVLPLDYIRTTRNRDQRAAFEAALYNNIQTGAAAARMALQRAGLKPDDIGLVISGSCTPDTLTPAESATIAAELGIEAPCVDINSACSTFGMQINLLDNMKPETLPPYVLVVNPENMTRSIDYSDRSIAVLFGDGSSAAVVSAAVPANKAFLSCFFDSKPSSWEKVSIPRMGYFQQDGNAVQRFAIHKTTESLCLLKELFPVNGNRFKFIGHQANLSMLNTVCDRADILPENHWHNVKYYGNTGCAGAPAVLSQHWDDLQPGHHVAITLVGAGLTWTHMLLKVAEEE